MEKKYDIIIAGAGLAGLTLLRYLIEDANCKKEILVIDRSSKNSNDKTYSFWSRNNDYVKNIPHKKWEKYQLMFSEKEIYELEFSPYDYYSLKSLDFYNYVKKLSSQKKNIQFIKEEIESVNYSDNAIITKSGNTFSAPLVFNSYYNVEDLKINKPYTSLKQHFKGYVIETEKDHFKEDTITLMDFRTEQQKEVHFFYVLPQSKTKALIEYTVFSESLLDQGIYDTKLKNYIEEKLSINNYEIIEEEFGVIPMTDQKFKLRNGNSKVYNIGTIAGFVKGSTGYSFYRCNERIKKLVQVLNDNNYTIPSNFNLASKYKYRLFDSILLSAMQQKKIDTKSLFKKLYLDHKHNVVFDFLNEETNLFQEILIMLKSPSSLIFNFFSRMFRFRKW